MVTMGYSRHADASCGMWLSAIFLRGASCQVRKPRAKVGVLAHVRYFGSFRTSSDSL